MLLPSDVARLVLGYLQQEKLTSTCRAFIMESSDLKEYAEHYTDDGCVPGCVLSLFGKNLTTILNEYVTMKARETTHDVPAMMSSLWKKLDYTLAQIRSMQNSTAFSTHQRTRTRNGLANVRRQQASASLPTCIGSGLLTVSQQAGQQTSPPLTVANIVHRSASRARSNPLLFHQSSAPDSRSSSNINAESNLHMSLPGSSDKRQHLSLLSPGGRKSDTQKRRSMVLSGPHTTFRNIQCSSTSTVGENDVFQELREEMVIQNAREAFLSNRCLQEKLAENINKCLVSDTNAALTSRQTDSAASEPDPAFDEILALEGGEIHMSEEALQDILEQTASDPAFQGLFDLFEYGKSKGGKCATQDCSSQSETEVLSTAASLEANSSTLQSSAQTQEAEVPAESVLPTSNHSKSLKNDSQLDNTLQKIKVHNRCPTRKPWKSTEKQHEAQPSSINEEPEEDAISSSQSHLDEHNPRQSTDSVLTVMLEAGSETTMDTYDQFAAIPDVQGESGLGSYPSTVSPHSQDLSNVQAEIMSDSSSRSRTKAGSSEQHKLQGTQLAEKFISANYELSEEVDESVRMQVSNHQVCCTNSSSEKQQEENKAEPVTAVSLAQDPASQADCEGQSFFSVTSVGCSTAVMSDGPSASEEQHEAPDPSTESLSERDLLVECQSLPNALNVNSGSSDSEKTTEIDAGVKDHLLSMNTENLVHKTSRNVEGSAQNDTVSSVTPSNNIPPSESADTIQESSSLPEDVVSPSSKGEAVEVNPPGIVSLKIIISDEPSLSADTELNNAISSITGDVLPTIIMSSPAKPPLKNAALSQCFVSKETTDLGTADLPLSEKDTQVLEHKDPAGADSVDVQTEDGTMFSLVTSPHFSKDGGFLQLMPATSTSFGQSNSIFITTCLSEPAVVDNTVTQSNVMMLPSKTTQPQQLLQTPPKSSSLLTVSQTSPSYAPGSTIIIASPVQPLLQGMMGMIPVSVVGQNGNILSAPQILHMPIAASVGSQSVPKLPLPQKSQKLVAAKNTISGRKPASVVDSSSCQPGPHAQRSGKSEKNVTADLEQRPEESCSPAASDTTNTNCKPSRSHRRVLCFDSSSTLSGGESSLSNNTQTPSQSKGRKEIPSYNVKSSISASLSGKHPLSTDISRPDPERFPEGKCSSNSEMVFTRISTSVPVKEMTEKKSIPTNPLPDALYKTTANKENELRSDTEKQKSQEVTNLSTYIEKTVSSVPDVNRRQTCFPNILRRSYHEPKRGLSKFSSTSLSLSSPLVKQTGDLLQKLQRHSPAAKQTDNGDMPIPRTPGSGSGDRHLDDAMDSARTPTCKHIVEEGGTPRVLLPPATPEMPACSPASEASSENSVSMAAHTLMILSRAAIAKTSSSTPLKDNTQQLRSSRSTMKKRKLEELEEHESSSSKKEVQSSTTPLKRKRMKKQKKRKLLDSFPAGMDVDKFLLSLHYDE